MTQMIERRDFAERFTDYGKAVLIGATLVGGGYAVISKTVATVQAGPAAKAQAEQLNIRVTKLEKQSTFVVRGIEKLTHTKYSPDVE